MSSKTASIKETFISEAITPVGQSFSVESMAMGNPGLPREFSWNGQPFSILEVVEQWKESGDCRHGSGERYIRKHWFRIRTSNGLEMKIYFERQKRSSGGARWRLYSARSLNPPIPPSPASPMNSCDEATDKSGSATSFEE